MTYLNDNYGIVKFEKSQSNKVSDKQGIYKVVALPITFSKDNKSLIKDYIAFFQNFSLHKWENELNAKIYFDDSELLIKYFKKLETNILNKCNIENGEDLFQKIKQIVHFLPSLYVGQVKEQTFKIRFAQHLNESKEDSLINRINKVDVFKKSYKLFIFTEVDKEYINFIESFLIQTTNPIFNKQRS
ncbi:MAG: hypothetical protein QM493_11725 [Sulfurovum sp.]